MHPLAKANKFCLLLFYNNDVNYYIMITIL